MIPKAHYYSTSKFTYITSLFMLYHSEEDWKQFDCWLGRATVDVVNGELAIYS